jgi:hypothetical protein
VSVDDTDWDVKLEHAFGLLLGRPLREFDPAATYATFSYTDETATGALAEIDPADLVAAPSNADSRSVDSRGDGNWYEERWKPDLGRSAFVIYDDAESELVSKLRGVLHGADFDADLAEAVTRRHPALLTDDDGAVVWGRDLGRAMLDGIVDLPALRDGNFRFGDVYPPLLLRAQTDGSLFDAMRAATWTMSAPAGLTDLTDVAEGYGGTVEVEERWDAVLRDVPDPALRSHLRGLCLDAHWARSHGAYYLGPDVWPGDLTALARIPGHDIVAGWTMGEGQGAIAVISMATGSPGT